MPLHAVHSTVVPASYMYGQGAGWGGSGSGHAFPSWLGNNSKQGKLQRQLNDVQIRMRLKVSGDRNEIRQSYVPAVFSHIVTPLIGKGIDEVEDVISRMDEYYLSKDDWDTIVEIGVGDFSQDVVMKKIPTAAKTALTKKYNAKEHPIPFHKSADLGVKPTKKIAKGEVPDLEDVFDQEEGDEDADDAPDPVDDDVSKDKLIKGKGAPKARAKTGTSSKPKAQGKAKMYSA